MSQAAARRRAEVAFTILDALEDRALFGGLPGFHDLSTWRAWLVFLRAAYGLPLEGDDLETFRRHTGRTVYNPPIGGFAEVVCIVGRQSCVFRASRTAIPDEAGRPFRLMPDRPERSDAG